MMGGVGAQCFVLRVKELKRTDTWRRARSAANPTKRNAVCLQVCKNILIFFFNLNIWSNLGRILSRVVSSIFLAINCASV